MQFPGLRGHMEFLDCWTPLTYERYCNAYHGAYMGLITRKGVKSFRVKGVLKGGGKKPVYCQSVDYGAGRTAGSGNGRKVCRVADCPKR